jgi:large subunit ribosomal protein L15
MKTLSNLSPAKGSNKKVKRLGRGPGSRTGKTAGKGHKGQTARKGGGIRAGFEGGQMPLYRRLPKRGFTNTNRTVYNIVNLKQLTGFTAGGVVDNNSLNAAGLLKNQDNPVKILGLGEVNVALTVKVQKISASAKAAIEKAGGSVQEI